MDQHIPDYQRFLDDCQVSVDASKEGTCSICYEIWGDTEVVRLECHEYHKTCFMERISTTRQSNRNRCPTCRRVLFAKDDDTEDDDTEDDETEVVETEVVDDPIGAPANRSIEIRKFLEDEVGVEFPFNFPRPGRFEGSMNDIYRRISESLFKHGDIPERREILEAILHQMPLHVWVALMPLRRQLLRDEDQHDNATANLYKELPLEDVFGREDTPQSAILTITSLHAGVVRVVPLAIGGPNEWIPWADPDLPTVSSRTAIQIDVGDGTRGYFGPALRIQEAGFGTLESMEPDGYTLVFRDTFSQTVEITFEYAELKDGPGV